MAITDVTTIGWIVFGIGILFALIGLFFDLELGFETLSVGCFTTVLGGSVLVCATWMDNVAAISIISLFVALVLTLLVHFYIVPLKKVEASLSYSIDKLKGATGEVITTIPADGMGEVLIKTGLGVNNRSACSYDQTEIPEGSKVLVMDIKDNVFLVSKMDED